MRGPHRFSVVGRLVPLAFSLTLLAGGCGANKDGETSEVVAKAQAGESSAWAKAKAEGKDKRASSQASNRGSRGYVNRPGS